MSLWSDLRSSVRALRRRPGYALVAIGTLGLGIGASSAMYSIANTVVLARPPYPDADRLVRVYDTNADRGWTRWPSSPATFADWRAQQRAWTGLASYNTASPSFTGVEPAEPLQGVRLSSGALGVLGVAPAIGRAFTADEERAGSDHVVLLSDGFWRRQFGADPSVAGRSISLDGEAWTVIGVMPRDFSFPMAGVDVWTPLSYGFDVSTARGVHYISVFGRLRPGVTLAAAAADLEAVNRRLAERFPEEMKGWGVQAMTWQEATVGRVRSNVLVFLGAVALLLVVAWVNVINLELARAVQRERELAVRAALGAGRGRLVRQLVTEGIVTAAIAGGAGLLLAVLIVRGVRLLAPANLPRIDGLSVDAGAVAFVVLLSLVVGLGLGCVSAWRTTRTALAGTLRDGGRGTVNGLHHQRLQGTFVVAQLALALMLSVGAALLVRTYANLAAVQPGYAARRALTGSVSVPSSRYPDPQQRARFFMDLVDRLRTVPGVSSAAATTQLPLDGYSISFGFWLDGQTPTVGSLPNGDFRVVTPGYFGTMGIPLLRGRTFRDTDDASSPAVIIIDRTLAERQFGTTDPLGRRMYLSTEKVPVARTVVGVVADVRQRGLDVPFEQGYYLPVAQSPWSSLTVVLRTDGEPAALADALRRTVASIDPLVPVRGVQSLGARFASSIGARRFNMLLLAAFATIALLLATTGIYSVMSYVVSQRTHEIGVRLALGARGGDVGRLIARTGLRWTAAGISLGVVGALALSRMLGGLLFGVAANDVPTLGLVSLGFVVVSAVGAWIPARRASSVDPIEALRTE